MDDFQLQPAKDHGLSFLQRLRSVRREAGFVGSVVHMTWWSLVKCSLRFVHRLEVTGTENLPATGPFVMAANHSSHLDALVLAAALPWSLRDHAYPLAAGDTFFKGPASALLAAGFINALPMNRRAAGAHALDDLRSRLAQDSCVLIVFPEGTRTRTGEIAPFKSGLGRIVAATPAPVVPCRLFGAFEALPAHRRIPKPTKLRLQIGKPMSFSTFSNDREGWDQIASEIEGAVRSL